MQPNLQCTCASLTAAKRKLHDVLVVERQTHERYHYSPGHRKDIRHLKTSTSCALDHDLWKLLLMPPVHVMVQKIR